MEINIEELDENSSSNLDETKPSISKELSIENEPFYFESDTLALRNNPDYSCLLKILVLLEAQRVKACSDLEKLLELKENALEDPINFVNKIKSVDSTSKEIEFPPKQKIYTLPEIDWNKYYDCVDADDLESIKEQSKQRTHSLRQATKIIQQLEKPEVAAKRTSNRTTTPKAQSKKDDEDEEKKPSGRSYNKPWSVEEQRTLEELLIEYPPEDNEAARWRKIASKLGTRTPLQVQSHCQKYFIKLAKAGLPIPGRMPNLKTYITKKGTRGNRKSSLMRGACHAIGLSSGAHSSSTQCHISKRMVGRGSSLNEISSMWTSFNPPIIMNDDEREQQSFNEEFDDNDEEENEEEEEEDFENGDFEDADERVEQIENYNNNPNE